MVGAGNESLELMTDDSFDMAVAEIGVEDINPRALGRDMRGASASIGLMVIPPTGDEVLDEMMGLEIQSLSAKPFFVDDLSAIVSQAMAWGGLAPPPTSAAVLPEPHVAGPLAEELGTEGTAVDSWGTAAADALLVGDLAIVSHDTGRCWSVEQRRPQSLKRPYPEMRAEVIIVRVNEEIIACVGSIGPKLARDVAGLVSNSVRAADRAARSIGLVWWVPWAACAEGSQ